MSRVNTASSSRTTAPKGATAGKAEKNGKTKPEVDLSKLTDAELKKRVDRQQTRLRFINKTGKDDTPRGKTEERSLLNKIKDGIAELGRRLLGRQAPTDGNTQPPDANRGTPGPTTPAPSTPAPVEATNIAQNRYGEVFGMINGMGKEIDGLMGKLKSLYTNPPKNKDGEVDQGALQAKVFELQTSIQTVQQTMSMLTTMLTNLIKTEGDTQRAIVSNLRA